ncbi:hypothetical protein D2T29_16015 [Sinirhodobacter populi]|uniref:Uncharacterized protein n=1 Tax=Paenirhodobacter populi TaxID=2306993 RepID=A0A443K7T5_9RHOB|nr:hypothetical protein [Sinirhodobacter populi]RWR28733.1 hypothetical protein D2T29_16015 [Sinirhodobacter populi]
MLTSLLIILYVIGIAVWMAVLFYAAIKTPGQSGAGLAIVIICMAWAWPITWIACIVFDLLARNDAANGGNDAA